MGVVSPCLSRGGDFDILDFHIDHVLDQAKILPSLVGSTLRHWKVVGRAEADDEPG